MDSVVNLVDQEVINSSTDIIDYKQKYFELVKELSELKEKIKLLEAEKINREKDLEEKVRQNYAVLLKALFDMSCGH